MFFIVCLYCALLRIGLFLVCEENDMASCLVRGSSRCGMVLTLEVYRVVLRLCSVGSLGAPNSVSVRRYVG